MSGLTLGDLGSEPYGYLRIREVSASELPAADMNGYIYGLKTLTWIGKSDPYFIILFAGHKYKSEYIKKTLNAKWNLDIELPFLEKDLESEIKFTFWDHDLLTADDHLGEVTLKLEPERILQCHSLTQFGDYNLVDKKKKALKATLGFSAHVECPKIMYKILNNSKELGELRSALFDLKNIASDNRHKQNPYFDQQTFSILQNLVNRHLDLSVIVADILIAALESKIFPEQALGNLLQLFIEYPESRNSITSFLLRKKELLFPPTRVHGVLIQTIRKETEVVLYSQQILSESLQSYLTILFSLLVGTKQPQYDDEILLGFEDICVSKYFTLLLEDLFMLIEKETLLKEFVLYILIYCYRAIPGLLKSSHKSEKVIKYVYASLPAHSKQHSWATSSLSACLKKDPELVKLGLRLSTK